jgi:hypothetical protein
MSSGIDGKNVDNGVRMGPEISIPQYLTAFFKPLRGPLLAYAYGGGDKRAVMAAASLFPDITLPGSAEEAWRVYESDCKGWDDCIKVLEDENTLPPIGHVYHVFGLSAFERFALCLVLAKSLEPGFEATAAAVVGLVTLPAIARLYASSPEEGVALTLSWHWNKKRLGLVFAEEANGVLILRQALFDFLTGNLAPPRHCSLFTPDDPLPNEPVGAASPDVIERLLSAYPKGLVVALCGERGSGRKYQVKRFVHSSRKPVLFIPYESLPEGAAERAEILSFLALAGGRLCVCDVPDEEKLPTLSALSEGIFPASFFITGEKIVVKPPAGYKLERVDIPKLSVADRDTLWQGQRGKYPLPEHLGDYAARFRFTPGQVVEACAASFVGALRRGEDGIGEADLLAACRRQFSHRLTKFAALINANFCWDDIVLSKKQVSLLHHICDRVKHWDTVYHTWGFNEGGAYGNGIRALFTGPPGTGKTMAAQIIAAELGMELYRIDISSLVSKYIGDTEKNLDEVFREAAKSGGILFFDEADAVFGKRGEQKDSHDRYANMQTSFLLQRFEAYDGIVFLATNLQSNMDPAYLRRIHVSVNFIKPDKQHRERIWEKMLSGPFEVSDGVDPAALADQFEMTGAEIKNCVMTAAFLAAAKGGRMELGQIIRAIIMENEKNGRQLVSSQLGIYSRYMNREGE